MCQCVRPSVVSMCTYVYMSACQRLMSGPTRSCTNIPTHIPTHIPSLSNTRGDVKSQFTKMSPSAMSFFTLPCQHFMRRRRLSGNVPDRLTAGKTFDLIHTVTTLTSPFTSSLTSRLLQSIELDIVSIVSTRQDMNE